ncbi:MAG: thioredoxin-like domain-containing protein [Bacteroidales bacterium]
MKRIHLILGLLLLSSLAFSQDKNSFELTVKVKDYPDSLNHVLLLGRYYWNTQYITDTATYNAKTKKYVFKNTAPKEGGLYLLISADKRFTEVIIDKDQKFGIETSYPYLSDEVVFTNSPENKLYQDFAEAGKANYLAMDSVQKLYKAAKDSNNEKMLKQLGETMNLLYSKFENHKIDFTKAHPDHVMSLIFKAQQEIEVPQAPQNIPDSQKQEWRYQYYKAHYFDNINLCDDRLLRTPIFHQRFENYIDKVLPQHPDSIKFGIEEIIEKTRCNKELFKYTVWYPVDKYQRSEIIGQDAIWVYLAEKYYLGGEAYWTSEAIIENFAKRIKREKPLLIGNKPAEFMCPDTSIGSKKENWVSVFSSHKKYTVIIFWEMDCGHCKKALPKLLEIYHQHGKELDMEVIAINKDTDIEAWKKYIQEQKYDWINLMGKTATIDYNDLWNINSTPTIYVLDRDKRIVTKRIDPEHIEPFIRLWEETHYAPKAK